MVINAILQKYPQHKRVLFFKAKYDNDELLSVAEKSELKRFENCLADYQRATILKFTSRELTGWES